LALCLLELQLNDCFYILHTLMQTLNISVLCMHIVKALILVTRI